MADDKKILIDITIDTEALEKSRDKAILAVAAEMIEVLEA